MKISRFRSHCSRVLTLWIIVFSPKEILKKENYAAVSHSGDSSSLRQNFAIAPNTLDLTGVFSGPSVIQA
jgi:hypothetical protein